MQDCGIRVIREHLDPTWFFGADALPAFWCAISNWRTMRGSSRTTTPPAERYTHVTQFRRLPTAGRAQNYAGWCNAAASSAIVTATDTR